MKKHPLGAASRSAVTALPSLVAALSLLAACGGPIPGPVGVEPDSGAAADAPSREAELTDPDESVPAPGTGVITLSGGSESGESDGDRSLARFNNPTNVALGPDGNLYVADYENGVIRVVRPSGRTLTFIRQEGFAYPFGMAFAPDGTLYVQTDGDDAGRRDYESGTIWRVDRDTGVATPLVRSVGRPRGLVVLPDGRLVMADNEHHVVRILDVGTRQITDLAGGRDAAGYADGAGAAARFDHPYDVVLTRDNVLIVADQMNNRLRAVTLDGTVTTYAGSGAQSSADGASAEASFNHPQGLALDANGNVFVTDLDGYAVRRVSPDGVVTTVAGTGSAGFANGEPMRAQFFGLEGIDVSQSGNTLFVADGDRGGEENSHRLRRVGLFNPKG